MIFDCYESVKFLNRLPSGALEEILTVFRNGIFTQSDRKQIPKKIQAILEKELAQEKANNKAQYQNTTDEIENDSDSSVRLMENEVSNPLE